MIRDRAALLAKVAGLEREPRSPAVRLALAEAEFRLALLPGAATAEAIERLRRALGHDPYAAKAELHLGRLLQRSGRRWEALAAYRRGYRLAPANRRIPLLAAAALLDLGRPERELGAELLIAVVRDDQAAIDAAVTRFDTVVDQQKPAADEPVGPSRAARGKRAVPTPDLLGRAAPSAWRALLHEQLVRKPPADKWVTAYVGAGVGPEESAVAATLLLGCGAPPAAVRSALAAGSSAPAADHPAARMLAATLDLAADTDPGEFVRRAAALLEGRWLPPELVVALHFERWGDRDVLDGLALLEGYPAPVRELDCFRELRIAVLDGPARKAWADGRFDEAATLWRAMIRLDPDRADTALNLAMHASRSRSPAYRPAWDRVAELLYQEAVAAGEADRRLADRIALHKAHSTQSMRTAGSDHPDDDALGRWIGDGDAVEVWLREWDLYYLNARLRFRSVALLLGSAGDDSPADVAQARRVLLRHLDAAFARPGRPGGAAYAVLAQQRVAAATDGGPPGDRTAFEDLEREALDRALLLRRVLWNLGGVSSSLPRLRQAAATLRHLFLLPLPALERRCAELGLIATDETLTAILDVSAGAVTQRWPAASPAGESEVAALLSGVETAYRAAAEPVGLAVPYGRLLLWNGRPAEAYAAAARALGVVGATEWMRDLLAAVADDAGAAALKELTGGPDDGPGVRVLLRAYPLSTTVRAEVADRLARLGGEAHFDEAAHLLSAAAREAPAERMRSRLYARVRALPRAADAAVHRQIRRYRAKAAVADLRHALELARARRFEPRTSELRSLLAAATRGTPDVHG